MPRDFPDDWTARLSRNLPEDIPPQEDERQCAVKAHKGGLYGVTIKAPYTRRGEDGKDEIRQLDKSIEFYDVECEGDNKQLEIIMGARKVWKITITGLNLLALQDWFREHACNWIRVAIGNSAKHDPPPAKPGETPPVFISSIRLADVTKSERPE